VGCTELFLTFFLFLFLVIITHHNAITFFPFRVDRLFVCVIKVEFNSVESHLFLSPIGARTLQMPAPCLFVCLFVVRAVPIRIPNRKQQQSSLSGMLCRISFIPNHFNRNRNRNRFVPVTSEYVTICDICHQNVTFLLLISIKPENSYFASCPGLEVKPLGVYPLGPRTSSCGPTECTTPPRTTLRAN